MKIFYNSRLAKTLLFKGYSTMMLFGVIITKKEELTEKVKIHEGVHIKQFIDCFVVGFILSLIIALSFFAINAGTWKLLYLLPIPFLTFYAIYVVEWVYWVILRRNFHEAYRSVAFERQARWIAETWNLPKKKQNKYRMFDWWNI